MLALLRRPRILTLWCGLGLTACGGVVSPLNSNWPVMEPPNALPVSTNPDAGPVNSEPTMPPAVEPPGALPADAGQLPAAVDAGVAPAAQCTASILCDDFESYSTGSAPKGAWILKQNQGKVTVDEGMAFKGKKSLKMVTEPFNGGDSFRRAMIALEGKPYFPTPVKTLFGRARMYLGKVPPGPGVHYDFFEGHGPRDNTTTAVAYGGMVNKKLLAVYGNWSTGDDCSRSAPTMDVPEDKWVCMEWQFDSAKAEMRLWIDSVLQTEVSISKRGDGCVGRDNRDWLFPDFNYVELGWRNWQGWGPGQTIWMDDVALSNTRIGCN
jgi:hypothetical protein